MQRQTAFRNLIDLFNESLDSIHSVDKVCLEIVRPDRWETLTFEQLRTRARDFAVWLIQCKGIRIGDKVAILGKNRADWDVAFWGTILAGAQPVLIDPERPVDGVTDHLAHTDTRLVVVADDYQDVAARAELGEFAAARDIGVVPMTVHDRVGLNRADVDDLLSSIGVEIGPEMTAAILCTSGTTGDPREVELTHENFITNLQGSVEKVQITPTDTLGHILPPHHSFGLTVGKMLALCVGATNVYTNKYREIAEFIRDKDITIFVAVPALFTMLAKGIEEVLTKQKRKKPYLRLIDWWWPERIGKAILKKQGWEKLRFFLSGSAPMPRWVIDVCWRRGLLLYEGYGTTENSPVYGFNNSPTRLGSVGKPISTLSVKIVDEENQTLPPGEKGEIALGGPCIMKGYYKNPKSTQAVIRTDEKGVRWLLTGDVGYLDVEGNLYITGRKKYVIVLPGGKNVHPERVESALSEAEYVHEVLVVPGLWKDATGIEQEIVKAIVRPAWEAIATRVSFSPTDLEKQPKLLKNLIWQNINECQQRSRQLSSFEKISSHHLEIRIEEFQKTATGKVKREAYMRV
jgi:long-chain acyl-CoA synthetase